MTDSKAEREIERETGSAAAKLGLIKNIYLLMLTHPVKSEHISCSATIVLCIYMCIYV